MHSPAPPGATPELSEALDLMASALEILDQADAPGRIGATLDLAISSLSAVVGQRERASARLNPLAEGLEQLLPKSSPLAPHQSDPWENP